MDTTAGAPTPSGDHVCVANLPTVTEAYLIQGALTAGGLDARVPDSQVAQTHSLITVAMGGVRVTVPAAQEAAAREILQALDHGQLQLEAEDSAAPTPPRPVLLTPVFSVDQALLLSILLTPVFVVAIHLVNARILRQRHGQARHWLALALMLTLVGAALLLAHDMSPGPWLVFRASPVMLVLGLCWYFFFGGHAQSRHLMDTYGPNYPRLSLRAPALATAVAALLVGSALDHFFI